MHNSSNIQLRENPIESYLCTYNNNYKTLSFTVLVERLISYQSFAELIIQQETNKYITYKILHYNCKKKRNMIFLILKIRLIKNLSIAK